MRAGKDPAVVVGAGLAGSLLALMLGRRGRSVDVYERRPDLRRDTRIGVGRSINLALSVRGLHALSQVGLREKVLTEAIAMTGRMLHSRDGALTFQRYGNDDSECIYSISRGFLNRLLMTEAEATGKVTICFEETLTAVDLGQGRLTFQNPQGKHSVHAKQIFGSDGSASALRAAIQAERSRGTHDGIEIDTLEQGYKELTLQPGPESQNGGFRLVPHALHIWPRGQFMMIALPNRDRTFTCTLFLSKAAEQKSFAALTTDLEVRKFFDQEFPDLSAQMPDLEAQFFSNPVGSMVTVKAPHWTHEGAACQALILGDAAHAIVPFFGQGMNCAFEDVAVLGEWLDGKANESHAGMGAKFFELRKANADAIADMARENFVEMRDKTADPQFLFEKQIEQVLARRLPGRFISRYGLVSFSRVPYALAYRCGEVHRTILDRVITALRPHTPIAPVANVPELESLMESKVGPAVETWIDRDLEPLMREARRYL